MAAAVSKQSPVARHTEVDEKDQSYMNPHPQSTSRPPSPPQSRLLTLRADVLDEEATVAASPDLPASPPPEQLQRWNESRTTMFRFFFTLYSFTIMGMNDGAVGVRISCLWSSPGYWQDSPAFASFFYLFLDILLTMRQNRPCFLMYVLINSHPSSSKIRHLCRRQQPLVSRHPGSIPCHPSYPHPSFAN